MKERKFKMPDYPTEVNGFRKLSIEDFDSNDQYSILSGVEGSMFNLHWRGADGGGRTHMPCGARS